VDLDFVDAIQMTVELDFDHRMRGAASFTMQKRNDLVALEQLDVPEDML
jgi:hypothetical protein